MNDPRRLMPAARRRAFAGCGFALLLLFCSWLAVPAHAYVLDGARWPSNKGIVMYLGLGSPGSALIDGSTSWDQVAESALATWNPYLGSGVQFQVAGTTTANAQGDKKNSVFFSSTIYGQTFGSDTLGVTLSSFTTSGGSKVFTEADVIFNSAKSFNSYRGALKYTASGSSLADLRRVAIHEFGHALGLDHVSQSTVAIMAPYITDLDTVQADDIAGVQAIYGSPAAALPVPVVTSALTASGPVNTAFSYQIAATNSPTIFGAAGLPPGLSYNASTGVISGTPTTDGLYTVTLFASNAAGGNPAGTATLLLAVLPRAGTGFFVNGAAQAVAQNIFFMGNTYDQALMTGAACMVGADSGQITRVSFIDLNDDIVFAEFGGAGALIITLDSVSGPAPAAKYNQPGVNYMKGRASFRIVGANASTYFSTFSLGTDLTRIDGRFLIPGAALDGIADVGLLTIANSTAIGGVNAANAIFAGSAGRVGIFAPGVAFSQYLYVGDISAADAAIPTLDFARVPGSVQITGGDFFQPNGEAIRYLGSLSYTLNSGLTSTGVTLPAQTFRGTLVIDPSTVQ